MRGMGEEIRRLVDLGRGADPARAPLPRAVQARSRRRHRRGRHRPRRHVDGRHVRFTLAKSKLYPQRRAPGLAFPAGLGAKCGAPERPVITFTGDAGFWYHIAEIETAVRWKINAITVVNNN